MVYNDIWREFNFYGLLVAVAVIGFYFYRKVGFILSATWTYFLWRGLFGFQNPAVPALKNLGLVLDQAMGQAFSQLIVIPLAVFCLPEKLFRHWKLGFLIFGVINGILLMTKGYGFFNAHSFDAAMIVQLMPFAPPLLILVFMVMVFSAPNGATAFLMLSSYGLALALHVRRFRWHLVFAVGLGILGAAFFLPFVHGFNSTGRIPAWIRFFNWWQDNASYLFGTGTGSFLWIGPYIDEFKGNVFLQMHNDWLQVLFEGGFVGLGLAAASWFYLLYHSWSRPRLFLATVGLGVFALTYHPLRFFPSALFIAFLIREVISNGHTSEQSIGYFYLRDWMKRRRK